MLRFLTILYCCVFPLSLSAEVFKYVDDQGISHYVTDQNLIPEAYKDQATAPAELPTIQRVNPAIANYQAVAQQKKVQVLVASWCPHCNNLEYFLKQKRIAYQAYDVEHDSRGIKLYQQIGGTGLPIVIIGKQILKGFNPAEILSALKAP